MPLAEALLLSLNMHMIFDLLEIKEMMPQQAKKHFRQSWGQPVVVNGQLQGSYCN